MSSVSVEFYKQSLKNAGETINQKKQTKALKDVIGYSYEQHRKRIWEHLGFTVDKNNNGAAFDVDWSIYYNGKLVALEEDKGHYVDSCFLERCVGSFMKTIHRFNKENKECPQLILSSFTKYNIYNEKINEDIETRRDDLCTIFDKKMNYCYLNQNDRFPKNQWFKSDHDNTDNPYENFQNDDLILKDIQYMISLRTQ